MKKAFVISGILLLVFSCRKTSRVLIMNETEYENYPLTEGFPTDNKAHAYMYSCKVYHPSGIAYIDETSCYINASSCFFETPQTVPLRALRQNNQWLAGTNEGGDLNVGTVYADTFELTPNTTIPSRFNYFFSNVNDSLIGDLEWKVEGKNKYPSMTANLGDRWPIISNSTFAISEIYLHKGIIFKPQEIAQNFDSLIITIRAGAITLRKFSTGSDSIYFTPEDFKYAGNSQFSGSIYYKLYNYNHAVIGGKKYLFETASQYSRQLLFLP